METELIKNSQTITDAIKLIYGYDNGKTRKKFFEFIELYSVDISHLKKKKTKYEYLEKNCPICNNLFVTITNHKHEKTTCSYSCSNSFFRSGPNNPNWVGSVENRERNGYRRIGFDNHKKECVVCGESKIVAIHHYDCNKKNNSPENLIPLCPTHHQYIHSRFKNEIIGIVDDFRDNFLKKNI
jgi:hypothetical protein